MALGIVVFVVIIEILRVDPLAEFRRQIEKAMESVVFVVILLELCFEIFH